MTQAPTPGPLDSESVKLLVKGDLLKIAPGRIGAGNIVVFDKRDGSLVFEEGDDESYNPDCYIFHSRPTLAPTAPVEASGSERDEAFCEAYYQAHLDHAWSALREGKPYQVNADGAISLIQQAALDRSTVKAWQMSPRPQPSGETREEIEAVLDRLNNESVRYMARVGGLSPWIETFKSDLRALLSARPLALGGQQGEEALDSGHGSVYDRLLTLIHDRDHALRGDTSTDPNEIDETVREILRITTPARAEAQDEGAAGDREALALDRLANAAEVVRRLLHKTKEVQGPSFREAGTSFSTAIDHARAVLRQRDALLSHPSPTPAADADRVRG